jgi:hypothetical protein
MFKIVGGDGREYGPVSAEEICQWISAGRANADTKAQREGETDWKPLSSFPEFAETLKAKPPQTPLLLPEPPPGEPAPDPVALAQEVLARQVDVSIGSCLGRAWDLLKSDFWPIVGVSALVLLLLGTANALYVGIVVTGPLLGGVFQYYLKCVRGQPAQLNDIFAGFSNLFLNLFLATLVAPLLVGIGIACCILPGIYLVVAWHLTLPLVVDKRLGFWEAMEVSRKVITARWWTVFGFVLVCGLINTGGALACGVGVFVTWPWTMLALVFLYDDLFGSNQPKAA